MKKIFFFALFVLCTLLLVGCDDSKNATFKLNLDSYSELREKLEFRLTLSDPDKQLEKTSVKGIISKKGSKDTLITKTVSFDSNQSATVTFTSLSSDTEYTVEFYAGYNGKKVSLLKADYKTSNEGLLDNPYKITKYSDFDKYRNEKDGHFILANDIDFEGKQISPWFSSAFTGTFDGNKKKISNFKLSILDEENNDTYSSSSNQYYGFFGNVGEGAKIFDLELNNFKIYVQRSSTKNTGSYAKSIFYYGVLAGYCAGEIENVKVTESEFHVKSSNTNPQVFKVGGLVGNLYKQGIIKNAVVDVDIFVEGGIDVSVGGIAGTTKYAELITGVVEGKTQYLPNISNASYTGTIDVKLSGTNSKDSQTAIGGLVGKNSEAIISDSVADVTFNVVSKFEESNGQSIFVGGLVGKNINDNSKVTNCNVTAAFNIETYDKPVESQKLNIYLGLIAGQNGGDAGQSSAVITNCTFTPKAVNSIKLYDDSNVLYHFNVAGNEVLGTKLLETVLTADASLTVQKYTLNDNKEYVASGEAGTDTIKK